MRIEFRNVKGSPTATEQLTDVFIDYESLYYSCIQQFSVPPNLDKILMDLKQFGRLIKIKVFGDFSNGLQQERNRVRTITSEIIDCATANNSVQKNHTDFIMLDHIYQELIQNPSVNQFILFTGDGHFSSAIAFLKTFMDKTVGVYGIRKTLSQQLIGCSTWAQIIEVFDVGEDKYIINLIHNLKWAEEKGLILTFLRTAKHTAQKYGGDTLKYQDILGKMIEDGYVESYMTKGLYNKKPFKAISPNWDKIKELQSRIINQADRLG